MRRKMVIANRKMHGNIPDNKEFLESLLYGVSNLPDADYVVWSVGDIYVYRIRNVTQFHEHF